MNKVIKYDPYIFLAIELDSEWSRVGNNAKSKHSNVFSFCSEEISKICSSHKKRMKLSSGGENYVFSNELYHPLTYLPSGRSDALSFVLVDDFDAVHHIATHQAAIENMSIGFCPSMENKYMDLCDEVSPISEHWKKKYPSVLFTKYKLDGCFSSECSLLFKRAVYGCMSQKINIALEWFKTNGCPGEKKYESCCISFLAMQGQEEIGVLYSGNNVNVGMAVVSAIRSLTSTDIYKFIESNEPSILRVINDYKSFPVGKNGYQTGKFHSFVYKVPSIVFPIFRWSNSIVGFELEVTKCGMRPHENISGFANIDFDFQFSPGIYPEQKCSNFEEQFPSGDGWIDAEIGIRDRRFSSYVHKEYNDIRSSVMFLLELIIDQISKGKQHKTEIVGTVVTYSFPVLNCGIFRLSRQVSRSPLEAKLISLNAGFSENGFVRPSFDFNFLLTVPRMYSFPKTLRRSIESLYKNFFQAVLNPNLYDLVVDLYDAFMCLYNVLVKELPESLSSEVDDVKVIEHSQVQVLSKYVIVLRNCFERRIDMAHPHVPVRAPCSQFPGSFTQLIMSSDAPLKSGLGVLKHYLAKGPQDDALPAPLDRVGVIADVGLEPGINASDLYLYENAKTRLSFFSLDIDHLFNTGSFIDYFHESFHLVFDEIFIKKFKNTENICIQAFALENNATKNRIEELFVNMCLCSVLGLGDSDEFIIYMIGKYSSDSRSYYNDKRESYYNFYEKLIIISMSNWFSSEIFLGDGNVSPDKECFLKYLEEILPVASKFAWLAPSLDDEEWENFVDSFKDQAEIFWIESSVDIYIPLLMNIRNDICQNLKSGNHGHGIDILESKRNEMLSGWSFSRVGEKIADYYDAVAVAVILLKYDVCQYVEWVRFDGSDFADSRMLLDRNPISGDVYYKKGMQYSKYLIDRGVSQRFCIVPKARANRLLFQISLLESFSDISSHYRARRICTLANL